MKVLVRHSFPFWTATIVEDALIWIPNFFFWPHLSMILSMMNHFFFYVPLGTGRGQGASFRGMGSHHGGHAVSQHPTKGSTGLVLRPGRDLPLGRRRRYPRLAFLAVIHMLDNTPTMDRAMLKFLQRVWKRSWWMNLCSLFQKMLAYTLVELGSDTWDHFTVTMRMLVTISTPAMYWL